jgi:hypothetical protein
VAQNAKLRITAAAKLAALKMRVIVPPYMDSRVDVIPDGAGMQPAPAGVER